VQRLIKKNKQNLLTCTESMYHWLELCIQHHVVSLPHCITHSTAFYTKQFCHWPFNTKNTKTKTLYISNNNYIYIINVPSHYSERQINFGNSYLASYTFSILHLHTRILPTYYPSQCTQLMGRCNYQSGPDCLKFYYQYSPIRTLTLTVTLHRNHVAPD